MKKLIVISLILILFAMSTAYAVWNDSVSATVNAKSVFVRMDYTDRKEKQDRDDNIEYTRQNAQDLSSSNPYFTIEERITDMYGDTSFQVIYTLENTGNTAVTLDGFSFTGVSFYSTWGVVTDTLSIEYEVQNNNTHPHYSATSTVTNPQTATQVTFANSQNNILEPGDSCTVTVTYTRSDVFIINWFPLNMIKTDNPMYSVYR